jgi:predicted negative regulator of RcsB-dependent stress response
MARRITRKQLKQSDEFVSTMDTVMQWLGGNWRPIIGAIAAVAVIALVWWMVGLWQHSRAEDASYALQHAVKVYEGEENAGQLEPAGDPEAAETEFLKVIEHYDTNPQADMARIYLARIHLDRGETDAARDLLVGVADRRRGDAVGRLATLDLIHLRIASGQATEVAVELEAMVAGADIRLPRDVALYELGQLYLAEQDPEQASDYFQKLIDEFPESPYVNLARRHLTEIG